MDINKKAKEFANYIKTTDEFKLMNKCKHDLDKNRSIKKQFDLYLNKKNSIYSNNSIQNAPQMINNLNREYKDFFNTPIVALYMESTKQFNLMMENLYKTIENELLK